MIEAMPNAPQRSGTFRRKKAANSAPQKSGPQESRQSEWVQRLIEKFLVRGRGVVRARQEAQDLAGIIRFAGLFGATIVLPALLLAYFGVLSVESEEQSVVAEVQMEAEGTADTFWAHCDRQFSRFENRVRIRLESGRSPIESPGELHPQLRFVSRWNQNGVMEAPFIRVSGGGSGVVAKPFDAAFQSAIQLERTGTDPRELADLYNDVAQHSSHESVVARAMYDQARTLRAAGNVRESERLFTELLERYGETRDPWGFRVGDLVLLDNAESTLETNPEAGHEALRDLLDQLLTTRWVVGQGAEPAVARRTLALVGLRGNPDWVASARQRLNERTEMLFWASQFADELDGLVSRTSGLRVGSGDLRWELGDQALWATTWWEDAFFVFGFDFDELISELKADARGGVLPDSSVLPFLVPPDEPITNDVLVQKSLAPWLTDWSLAISTRNPEKLLAAQQSKRSRRVGLIVLAMATIAIGAWLSAVLVKRELDFARMKTDFAASVSHELRSPITQIRLKGEMLVFGLTDTEEEREESYRAIVRESERLSRLVDNVLDFAAIERGAKSYNLQPGDISETVWRAVDSVSGSQELVDMEVDVQLPPDLPLLHHDRDGIVQCLINLISNAAKYSGDEKWIGVRGRVTGFGVEITVSDRGIGIPAVDLRHVFDPFFRSSDKAARMRKGTGIGLTITSYIMEAHGGSISVQSRLGQGSTFSLRFPVDSTAKQQQV